MTTLKLEINSAFLEEIIKEYDIDKWCIKLRNNLVLYKGAYLNLATNLLFLDVSKMKTVDLIYFPFDFLFHLLFLELELGIV